MTINNITNASKIMLGSQEIEKLYIGSTVLYLKSSSTPSESFFCKLELTDGTIVDLEGSGELTKEMVATPYASTLYKMHVGNLCTSIGYQAAASCKQLVEVIIDEGVTTVAGQAFNGDSKLEVIDFPSTLTSIGNYCFHNMGTGTCNIIFRGLTPPTVTIWANSRFESANIYVPDSSLSTYQTTWSELATKIKALSTIYYDAEIEYLESTGTQWIDTLIHPTTGYGFELYGGFTVFQNGEFFGGGNNYGNGLGICTHGGTGSYGIIVGATEVCTIPAINNVMHQFRVNTDGTVYVDNEYKGVSSTAFPEGTYTMNIFRHSATQVPLQEKIYYCKIFNSESLVFDGIPVRKNGIGYMFDKVSKLLFSNQGTGSFTLGPDNKLPSEYTKLNYISSTSTGGQYIDLGLQLWAISPISYKLDMSVLMIGKGKDNHNQCTLFGNNYEVKPWPGFVIRNNMNSNVEQDQYPSTIYGVNNTVINILQEQTNLNLTTHNVTCTLFCGKDSSGTPWRFCEARIYYAKIWSQGKLVRDLIPCINSESVAGLYDKVEGKFYSSPNGVAFEYEEITQ